MKRMKSLLLVILSLYMFCFATCSKDDKKDDVPSPKGKVDVQILAGGINKNRQWYIREIKISYYSASGNLDSIGTPNYERLENGLLLNWDENGIGDGLAESAVAAFIPKYALWTLDISNQQISFTCNTRGGPCPAILSGTWQIKDYSNTFPYGESFIMERTYTAQNRKNVVTIELFGQSPTAVGP